SIRSNAFSRIRHEEIRCKVESFLGPHVQPQQDAIIVNGKGNEIAGIWIRGFPAGIQSIHDHSIINSDQVLPILRGLSMFCGYYKYSITIDVLSDFCQLLIHEI